MYSYFCGSRHNRVEHRRPVSSHWHRNIDAPCLGATTRLPRRAAPPQWPPPVYRARRRSIAGGEPRSTFRVESRWRAAAGAGPIGPPTIFDLRVRQQHTPARGASDIVQAHHDGHQPGHRGRGGDARRPSNVRRLVPSAALLASIERSMEQSHRPKGVRHRDRSISTVCQA